MLSHFEQVSIVVFSYYLRRQLAKCCDWCAALAGVYDYGNGKYPSDIFRRHENCRCMVTCSQERGSYQDVWTKVEYKTQKEAHIEREKEIAKEETLFGKTGKELENYIAKKPSKKGNDGSSSRVQRS